MYVVVPVAIVVGRWGGSLGSRSLYLCDRKENQTNDKERPKGGSPSSADPLASVK